MVNWDKNIQGEIQRKKREAWQQREREKVEKAEARQEARRQRKAQNERDHITDIINDLDRCELEAYLPTFECLSSEGPVIPTDPAFLKFFAQHTGLEVATLIDALQQVVTDADEPLGLEEFAQLLRDNSLEDRVVIPDFLRSFDGMEFAPREEARAVLRGLLQRVMHDNSNYNSQKWDLIVNVNTEEWEESVTLDSYIFMARRMARTARLLQYLEGETKYMNSDLERRILKPGRETEYWTKVGLEVSRALSGEQALPQIVVARRQPRQEPDQPAPRRPAAAPPPPVDESLPEVARRCALCLNVGGLCPTHAGLGKKMRAPPDRVEKRPEAPPEAPAKGASSSRSCAAADVKQLCDLCKATSGGLCIYHARSLGAAKMADQHSSSGSSTASGVGSDAAWPSSSSSSGGPPAAPRQRQPGESVFLEEEPLNFVDLARSEPPRPPCRTAPELVHASFEERWSPPEPAEPPPEQPRAEGGVRVKKKPSRDTLRRRAKAELQAALAARDPQRLEDAIVAGEEAGIDEDDLLQAFEALEEMSSV